MSLWLILASMTAVALGALVWPFVRRRGAAFARRDYELEVYRAQLEELERDAARGLIRPEEAAAARLEVQRRMLAADADAHRQHARPVSPAKARRLALALVLAFPSFSGLLYWQLGNPGVPGQPFALRVDERPQVAGEGGAQAPSITDLIARIEAHLQANPEDLEGWLRLARAYELSGQPAKAADAYAQAIARDGRSAEVHAAFAEASILAGGGTVTEKARAALERALELDPQNPRARYYQGVAYLQRGQREQALRSWADLIRDTPADAPWLPALQERAAALAGDLGRDPDEVLPAPAPPAAVAERAPDGLPAGEGALRTEAERIRAALDARPRDWQAWLRLARTHAALGEPEAAQAALAEGAEVYAEAPFVQQQFAAAAAELGVAAPGSAAGPTSDQMQAAAEMSPGEREEMIRGMVEGLAARLEEEPGDIEGWRMLARSYQVLGEAEKAAGAALRVARLLPEDPAAQLDYARTLMDLQDTGAPLEQPLVEQMRRVAELDRDNPEALFILGQAAAERGEVELAEEHWRRLLAQMPPDAPARRQLEDLIRGLREGG